MSSAVGGVDRKIAVLPTLTSLRWFAALVVFGYHLSTSTGWLPARAFGFGQAGVAFFFVLSGFVLTWSHRPSTSIKQFYRRRFARVYPSHFAMFVVAFVISVVWGSVGIHGGVTEALSNITLTQAWLVSPHLIYSYNSPSWTLSVEAFFYLLFPFIFTAFTRLTPKARTRVAIIAIIVGFSATLVLALVGLGGSIAFPNPVLRLPQFVLGIALAMYVREHTPKWKSLRLPTIVLAISLPIALVTPLFPLQDYVLIPAIAMLLLVGSTRDIQGIRSWLSRPFWVYMGELSFCFYLVHEIVIILFVESVWADVTWSLSSGVIPAVVTFAVSVGAAMALHHGIEKPLQRALSGRSKVAQRAPTV